MVFDVQDGLNQMLAPIENLRGAQEIRNLWEEYENQQTLESKIVKEMDRLDMVLQANEYETSPHHPFFFLSLTVFLSFCRSEEGSWSVLRSHKELFQGPSDQPVERTGPIRDALPL